MTGRLKIADADGRLTATPEHNYADGHLTNPDTEHFIRDLLERFAAFVRRRQREPAY